mgnify:CR=1 FL=1
MQPPYENRNAVIRNSLRTLGFITLPIGVIFAAVGLIDFFSAFGGFQPPTKFWCLFVAMPLVAIGIGCLRAGYLREIGGYVAGESAPVATDTLKYVSEEMRPSIRNLVQDFKETKSEDSPESRLETLNLLKSKGLISDAEYAQKRSDILRDI